MSEIHTAKRRPEVEHVKIRMSKQGLKTLNELGFIESTYSRFSQSESQFILVNFRTRKYSFRIKNEYSVATAKLVRPREIAALMLLSPEARHVYLYPEQS